MHSEDKNKLTRLLRKINPEYKLQRFWALDGGISTYMTALEVEKPDGETTRLIVRRPGDADFARNPEAAVDEYRLLQILQEEALAAPEPVFLDTSGEILPRPLLVVNYIEGETEFSPSEIHKDDFIRQQAAYLARTHAITRDTHDLSFLAKQAEITTNRLKQRRTVTDELLAMKIHKILDAVWPITQMNPSVLLHGDFWLGNILWLNGKLQAVIDWENAAIGDPLADLAIVRLEMLWMFDVEVMHNFTLAYQALCDVDLTNLPIWELCTVLRPAFAIEDWAGSPESGQQLQEKQTWFLNQARDRLGIL